MRRISVRPVVIVVTTVEATLRGLAFFGLALGTIGAIAAQQNYGYGYGYGPGYYGYGPYYYGGGPYYGGPFYGRRYYYPPY